MKFTKEEKLAFVKRYQEGEAVIRICNENQIPRSTFYRWIQDYQQRHFMDNSAYILYVKP